MPNFQYRISQQRSLIENARLNFVDQSDPELIAHQNNLATLLLQKDSYWRQHSKVYWLKDEDTNSRFFHAFASARKRENTITKLRLPNGTWLNTHDDLTMHVRDYFSSIFKVVHGTTDPVISCVQSQVTEEDNKLSLSRSVSMSSRRPFSACIPTNRLALTVLTRLFTNIFGLILARNFLIQLVVG